MKRTLECNDKCSKPECSTPAPMDTAMMAECIESIDVECQESQTPTVVTCKNLSELSGNLDDIYALIQKIPDARKSRPSLSSFCTSTDG